MYAFTVKGNSVTTMIQDLLSLDVDDNGYIFALDSTYGRIFVYNSENRLMSAFGGGRGFGNHLGTFTSACAIAEHLGDILVCDSINNNITVFLFIVSSFSEISHHSTYRLNDIHLRITWR